MSIGLGIGNSIRGKISGFGGAFTYLLDTYSGAAAAYSVRKLSSSYSGSVLRVRRSSDNTEQDIGFVGENLDTSALEDFVNARGYLLDNHSGAAAAYSVRKLSSTYSGSALRVRRSSDNAEQDIGFLGNDLDTATMESFVGAGDGFVVTWYDQSGNGLDAVQSAAGNQPKIVSSGSTITAGNQPTIEGTGSTSELVTSAGYNHSALLTAFGVWQPTASSAGLFQIGAVNTLGSMLWFNTSGAFENRTTISPPARFVKAISRVLQSGLYQNGALDIWINGSSGTSSVDTMGSATNAVLTLGSVTVLGLNGNMQEIVLYSSDESSNREAIESNINDYYSIYSNTNDGFVTTWYDQSGNGVNMIQATAANQPYIVESGTTVTVNGNPALRNPATETRQMAAATTFPTGDLVLSMFTVIDAEATTNTTANAFFSITPAVSVADRRFVQSTVEASTTLAVRYQGGNTVFSTTSADSQILYTTIKPSTNVDFDGWKNGSSLSVASSGAIKALNIQSDSAFTIFKGGTNTYSTVSAAVGNGYVQEGIFYLSEDKTTDREAIESNINTYYNIYGNYDADAEAYFTAAGITDTAEKDAVNQLVLDLKGIGSTPNSTDLWTDAAAFYPISPTSLSAAAYNLRDTTSFNMTWANSPTHASTGVTFDGSTQYGDTGFNPSTASLANGYDITLGMQVVNGSITAVGLMSAVNTTGSRTQMLFINGNVYQDIHNTGGGRLVASAGGTNQGRMIVSSDRIANGGKANYLNGTSLGVKLSEDDGTPVNLSLWAGAQNNGSGGQNFTPIEMRFGLIIPKGLNSTAVADLDDAIVRYSTALSRNI